MLHQLCDTLSHLSPEELAKVSVVLEAKAKQGSTPGAPPDLPVKITLITKQDELLTETVKEALRMVGNGKSLLAIHLWKCQVLRSVKAQFVTKQDWQDFLAALHSAFLGSIPGYQQWYAHRAALKVKNKAKHKAKHQGTATVAEQVLGSAEARPGSQSKAEALAVAAAVAEHETVKAKPKKGGLGKPLAQIAQEQGTAIVPIKIVLKDGVAVKVPAALPVVTVEEHSVASDVAQTEQATQAIVNKTIEALSTPRRP